MVMKKIRNQKYVCLLLAVIVMILGICLERVPANALFSCSKNTSVIRSDSTYKEVAVYQTETFKDREVLNSLKLAKREVRRNQERMTSAALCVFGADTLLSNYQSSQSAEEDRLYYETLCSFAILTYIHNQDGEKA